MVFNEILLLTVYWLKLYKYKNWVRVKKWHRKTEKNTGNWWSSRLDPLVLECCSGVGFGIGFEGASSGSTGLVTFWLFSVVNFRWSGMWSRSFWCRNLAW
jgi:hypothetical protein